MLQIKRIIFLFLLVFISACTADLSHIPNCDELNVTPLDCHSSSQLRLGRSTYYYDFNSTDYNISKAICMQPCLTCPPQMVVEMEFCFDTWERVEVEIDEVVNKLQKRSWFDNEDQYCFPDYGASIIETCDILTYEDGTTEKVNCKIYNDLVMHYRCVNASKVNVTRSVKSSNLNPFVLPSNLTTNLSSLWIIKE